MEDNQKGDSMRTRAVALASLPFMVFCVTASPSYAQESQAPAGHKGAMKEDFIKTLGLTQQQQDQIQKQRDASKEKSAQFKSELKDKRAQLKAELDKPALDKAKIDSITSDIMGKQLDERVNDIILMKQVLTPEQFRKFQEKRSKPRQQNVEKS